MTRHEYQNVVDGLLQKTMGHRFLDEPDEDCPHNMMALALADQMVAAEERGRQQAVAIIRQYLLFNSQRAVSWHEVNDCIEAIARLKEG